MLETFQCPSCNAALDIPDGDEAAVTCPYCGSTVLVPDSLRGGVETGAEDPQMAQLVANVTALLHHGRKIEAVRLYREALGVGLKEAKEAVERIESGLSPFEAAIGKGQRRSRGCGPAATLVALLTVAGFGLVFYLILNQNEVPEVISSITEQLPSSTRLVGGSAAFFRGEDGAPADLAFLEADSAAGEIAVAYFDGESGQVKWRSPSLGDSVPGTYFVQGNGRLYAISESTVRAYGQDSGELLWEGTLSDQLSGRCHDCALELADHFLALTVDGDLQAFKAGSGEPAWRRRGSIPSPDRLLVMGQRLGLMSDDEERGAGFDILDPSTGDVVRRIEPRCDHPVFDPQEPSMTDPVVYDATAGAVTFIFGFFEPGCVSRWDVASGEMQYSTQSDITALSFSTAVLKGRDAIYISADSRSLYAVSTADGSARLLPGDEDYELVPVAEWAGSLLLKSVRQRGTRRDELWAMDASTGEILWRNLPQADEMLEPGANEAIHANSAGLWSAHVSPRGVLLMQARHDPPRLIFETLNPLNGASSGQRELPIAGETSAAYWLQLLGWDLSAAWLQVDITSVWQVNAETAEVVTRWP